MNREIQCQESLARIAARLGAVLVPWGFSFETTHAGYSHFGPYSCGRFVRGDSTIEIAFSADVGFRGVVYLHDFYVQQRFCRERERFVIGHEGLMTALGRADGSHLVARGYGSVARDGGDEVEALVRDWKDYAAPVMSAETPEFHAILRTGGRSFSVEWPT